MDKNIKYVLQRRWGTVYRTYKWETEPDGEYEDFEEAKYELFKSRNAELAVWFRLVEVETIERVLDV